MIMKNQFRRILKSEQGEIAVFLACYLIILVLCLALVMDLGNAYLTQLQMRNAVDLAAASVTSKLPSAYSEAAVTEIQSLAEQTVELNGIDLNDVNMTCEVLNNGEQIYAVRIILDSEVHHYFAQLYLNRTSTIRVGDLVYVSQRDASASGYTITIIDS